LESNPGKNPGTQAHRTELPGNLVERPNKAAGLLNDVTWTEIAGIQRLATGKSFVLAMVKTDAIFAKPPAQVHFFVIDQGREVEQANLKIFDDATGFKDAIERGLQGFGQLLVFDAERGELFVRDDNAAHHGNPGGNRGQVGLQAGKLLTAIHGLHQEGFKLLAGAFRFGQRKNSRFRFLSLILILFVVFIRHGDSNPAIGPAGGRFVPYGTD
jgi:hypothetical protein